jgi:hypothetical protein
MTLLLERKVARSHASISRESISWTANAETVVVSIELTNNSSEATVPDTLVIEAAPFGAFVPNVPVTSIAVGSMDPGERRTLTTSVPRDLLDRLSTSQPWGGGVGPFKDAVNALIGGDSLTHWIGNLNVYFQSDPERAVERHCAFNLKVPAGSRVASMFIVKDASDCVFKARSSSDLWRAEVMGTMRHAIMAVQTPDEVGAHSFVTIDVIRTVDGKVVPVEFEFETVAGWGQSVGCVKV